MQWMKPNRSIGLIVTLAAVGFAPLGAAGLAAEAQDAVSVHVEDVSAKVGETATIVATITPRAGYKIADNYRNRVVKLSADDDGVEFDNKVVGGAMQDGSLVFKIHVSPKRPGAHPINGVLRFGLVNHLDGDYHLDIKWLPLMATVTGAE